jgi:hypothetical protein
VEAALYDQRSVVRMLGMRRTMFVLPLELVPVVYAACTQAVAARERVLLVKHLEGAGVATDGAAWLAAAEDATMAALEGLGGTWRRSDPPRWPTFAGGRGGQARRRPGRSPQ